MKQRQILVCDDYPAHSENMLFVERLRRKTADHRAHFEIVKTIRQAEEALRYTEFTCLILDIMMEVPEDWTRASRQPGEPKPTSALAGLELLKRTRSGKYGPFNQFAPALMRTARGEEHIRRMCIEAGAAAVCGAGLEDDVLIGKVQDLLQAGRVKNGQ